MNPLFISMFGSTDGFILYTIPPNQKYSGRYNKWLDYKYPVTKIRSIMRWVYLDDTPDVYRINMNMRRRLIDIFIRKILKRRKNSILEITGELFTIHNGQNVNEILKFDCGLMMRRTRWQASWTE